MRRLVLVVLVLAAWLVGPARPVAACSCAPMDTRDAFPAADGAIVGTVEEVERHPSDGTASARFRVEEVHKGDFGSTVEVHDAECGLGALEGQRYGLLLYRDGDRWTSHGCATVDPDDLARVAGPFAEPDGVGPPAVLVASTYGPGRLVTLDGSGRPLAFGPGTGQSSHLAFCPGGDRFAEIWVPPYEEGGHGVRHLAMWNLAGMRIEWSTPLPWTDPRRETSSDIEAVACTVESGETVRLLTYRYTPHDPVGNPEGWRYGTLGIRDVGPDGHGDGDGLWESEGVRGATFAAGGSRAYLAAGARGLHLVAVDLSDPARARTDTIATLPPGAARLVLSPDERHLAAHAENRAWEQREGPVDLLLVAVDLSEGTVYRHNLGHGDGAHGQPAWVDDEQLAFVSWSEVRLFDPGLQPEGRWEGRLPDTGNAPVTAPGGILVSLARGVVRTAPGASGPVAAWAELEDAQPHAIAVIPGGAAIVPAGASTTTTGPAPAEDGGQKAEGFEALAPSGNSGSGGRWIVGGTAAGSLLAIAGAVMLRRRRPSCP
jgi:hypothetical protein